MVKSTRKAKISKFDHQPDVLSFPYLIDEPQVALKLTYRGEPISKARPRLGGSRNVYTPARSREYEATLKWLIRSTLGAIEPDAKSRFALRCFFFRSTRQRIDCDNLIKAVSDAANGQVWRDDAQVMEIFGRLYLFEQNPRVEILIYRIDDSAPRQKCLYCGREFVTYPSISSQYCSTDCMNASKRVTLQCRECGRDYNIPQSLVNKRAGFCSRACARVWWGKQRRKEGSELWICEDCGKPVSRKEYKHCRACSMKYRSDPTSNYWKSRHAI